LKKEKYG